MRLPGFDYDIIQECGIVSDNGKETIELNVIRYNNGKPKYDLRKWEKDHPEEKYGKLMKKGLTFDEEQLSFLYEILSNMDLEAPIPGSEGFTNTGGFGTAGFTAGTFGD